jgi:hypothetical protein
VLVVAAAAVTAAATPMSLVFIPMLRVSLLMLAG